MKIVNTSDNQEVTGKTLKFRKAYQKTDFDFWGGSG